MRPAVSNRSLKQRRDHLYFLHENVLARIERGGEHVQVGYAGTLRLDGGELAFERFVLRVERFLFRQAVERRTRAGGTVARSRRPQKALRRPYSRSDEQHERARGHERPRTRARPRKSPHRHEDDDHRPADRQFVVVRPVNFQQRHPAVLGQQVKPGAQDGERKRCCGQCSRQNEHLTARVVTPRDQADKQHRRDECEQTLEFVDVQLAAHAHDREAKRESEQHVRRHERREYLGRRAQVLAGYTPQDEKTQAARDRTRISGPERMRFHVSRVRADRLSYRRRGEPPDRHSTRARSHHDNAEHLPRPGIAAQCAKLGANRAAKPDRDDRAALRWNGAAILAPVCSAAAMERIVSGLTRGMSASAITHPSASGRLSHAMRERMAHAMHGIGAKSDATVLALQ